MPIPKTSVPKSSNNYRPISLLSVVSKVLERHVYNLIASHLETNPLSDSQWGFRLLASKRRFQDFHQNDRGLQHVHIFCSACIHVDGSYAIDVNTSCLPLNFQEVHVLLLIRLVSKHNNSCFVAILFVDKYNFCMSS